MNEMVKTLDFDSEIGGTDEVEYQNILLPPGDYDFEVTDFEAGHYSGGAKLPACPKATVSFKIVTDKGTSYIKNDFFLVQSMEWKLSAFFRSVGMKKDGEKIRMDFPGAIGKTGRAKIRIDEWDSNSYGTVKTNKIVKFYPKKEEQEQPSAAPSARPVSRPAPAEQLSVAPAEPADPYSDEEELPF